MSERIAKLQQALGGAFTIERELGGAGMSNVYVATESSLGRTVVLKVLRPDVGSGVSAERFAREIRIAATLQHPCIVPVLTAGEVGALPFYTMPFVEGRSLRDTLADGPMPIAESVKVLRDVASALEHAHARGVVHRDVKPDNVLLSGGYAVVTDFGIAKALADSAHHAASDSDLDSHITQAGMALGTPAYMAPEQAFADPATDHRADLYAFGCLAYELLSGQPPFGRRTPQALFRAHFAEKPVPVEERRRDTPVGLARLVARCLEKEPSERPATATEVLIELEDLGLTSGSRTSARVLTPSATKEYALPALALSISVLPFVSLSGDPRDDALAEGMSEEIMATLGRQTLLRVTARTSAWRYKGQSADAREIARALHVANVLRGSIEREGDHLRVTALLLDGADAHVRWSTQYSRPMREVFAILDEIASAVADALSVMLLGENPRRPASLEAYEYYLRGRYLWNTQQTDEGLRLAMESFGQALQRDPTYAFAHAGIADTFLMMVAHSDIPRGEGYALAGKAAVEAIRLDPSNAEAHAFLGVVKQSDEWDFAGAEHSLRRSISLNPSYVPATQWLSLLLATVGRGDEAVATAEDVVALDPASSVSLGHAALVQYLARHHDRALKLLDRAERLEPTSPRLRRYRGQVYMATGKIEDAIDAFRAGFADDAGGRISHAFFGMACALTGRTTEARAVLADIEASATSGNADLRAIVLAGLGEKTRALDALEDATARRSLWPAMITADPVFDSLRTEPRFRMLLERILRRRGETDGPGPVAPVA